MYNLDTLTQETNLRKVWTNEAKDFTPWLAEHLEYIGNILEMDLELVEKESKVGGDNDCWDGKFKRNQANFHDWERLNFNELLNTGHLIDIYRTINPFAKEFSYFFRYDSIVRANNQGHRIDYFLASRSFESQIVRAEIIKNCTVSTNNPILLEIKY